jgi:hypothetical protein
MKAVCERLIDNEALVVMMDDTLIRKRGRKVYGTGWKRDPLGPHFSTNFVWGQRFLQMSAALPDADCIGRARGIPIKFVHAPTAIKPNKKKASVQDWEEYRRQQKITRIGFVGSEQLRTLRDEVDDKKVIICTVDGGYTNRSMFRELPDNTVLIGRIRKDAKLFSSPDVNTVRKGRPKWYGNALPTPEQIRQDETIPWQQMVAFAAGKHHVFDIKTLSSVRWIGSGCKDVRIVIIRPLAYRPRKGSKLLYRNPAYLICTDTQLPIEQLLQAYLWRWEIEVNFRDEKAILGVGEAQVRTPSSVEQLPSLIVAAYSMLLLAGSTSEENKNILPRPKWQKQIPDERCTTQQFVSLFRSQLWNNELKMNLGHFVKKRDDIRTHFYSQHSLADAVCYAYK